MDGSMDEVHYRLWSRIRGLHPGYHRSRTLGDGHEFREFESLLRAPDPRRLDINASLKNTFGELQVRTYRQRSAISLNVVADLSASMGTPGARGKLEPLARLVRLLGFSAARTGDRFGFIGCDAELRRELLFPPAKSTAYAEIAERLDGFIPDNRNSTALCSAAGYLGSSSSLVFLVSDFLFSQQLFDDILGSLARHRVIPVLFVHAVERDGPAASGLVNAVDSESGHSRLIWLRPAQRARIREAYRVQRERFEHDCERSGLKPLILPDTFCAEDVTRYFYPLL